MNRHKAASGYWEIWGCLARERGADRPEKALPMLSPEFSKIQKTTGQLREFLKPHPPSPPSLCPSSPPPATTAAHDPRPVAVRRARPLRAARFRATRPSRSASGICAQVTRPSHTTESRVRATRPSHAPESRHRATPPSHASESHGSRAPEPRVRVGRAPSPATFPSRARAIFSSSGRTGGGGPPEPRFRVVRPSPGHLFQL